MFHVNVVLLTQKTAEVKHKIPRREWTVIFNIRILVDHKFTKHWNIYNEQSLTFSRSYFENSKFPQSQRDSPDTDVHSLKTEHLFLCAHVHKRTDTNYSYQVTINPSWETMSRLTTAQIWFSLRSWSHFIIIHNCLVKMKNIVWVLHNICLFKLVPLSFYNFAVL